MRTVAQITKDYQDKMASSLTRQKYVEGIDLVKESPMERAATPEAMDLYLSRVQESVSSGLRERKLRAVPFSRYKDNAKGVGAARLADGAKKAASKVEAHFSKWVPIYESVSQTVRSMPKGGEANAKARVGKAIEMLMRAAGR